jgi:type II secretory pathway pseudopilin PulG
MRKGGALGGAESAESGETLIEILMTIAIVGIAFVAIMGAIFTALRVTDYHRKDTNATVLLRNFAETMKARNGDQEYKPCTAAGGTVSYTIPAGDAGYTLSIPQIRYLANTTSVTPVWQNTCPATDQGAQELTLRVDSPSADPVTHAGETVTIIKRDARGEGCGAEEVCG